jgi:hypothetical protein
MTLRKRLWIGVPAACLLILIGGVVGLTYWCGGIIGLAEWVGSIRHPAAVRQGGPAPDADEAPLASNGPGGHAANLPKCQWPEDFSLPVSIELKAPEVPEKIKGPAPSDQGEK